MQSQSSERTTVVWERTYCASEKNRIKKKKKKNWSNFWKKMQDNIKVMKASNKRLKFEDNAYNMYHLAKDD